MADDHLERFGNLYASGMAAKDQGNHEMAGALFSAADNVALQLDDEQRRLNALQPAARAAWSLGKYDVAVTKLQTAAEIAGRLELVDEEGIIESNLGRIIAVRTVRMLPVPEQAEALRDEAVPHFMKAFTILRGHPHFYYRYANAQHGSVVAALANERGAASRLLTEGLSVAFRRSPAPYDRARTYTLNRRGLVQFAAAATLLAAGSRTPVVTDVARSKLIR